VREAAVFDDSNLWRDASDRRLVLIEGSDKFGGNRLLLYVFSVGISGSSNQILNVGTQGHAIKF
jgi:hypothetical protein